LFLVACLLSYEAKKQIGLMSQVEKVTLAEKFASFTEHWRPKIVGELNGQEVKVVKFQGEFVWHQHEDADEMFLVWRGRMRVEFRDRAVELAPGEFLIVPRGLEHRTTADEETEVVLFDRRRRGIPATCRTIA
jgi:mannose-6-phosphate isomerase-like protein (cupin superfamily)